LESEKVVCLAAGGKYVEDRNPALAITIPANWDGLVRTDLKRAIAEQNRIRSEFQIAFSRGLIARSFERRQGDPAYVLYSD
ncbi:MAG TPA: hypothetical protein PKO33_18100, partial [Pyrinomonadaceae bacterium]|nr:hypothetical protein [Pyrinomonadaceae bacterium]